MATYLTTLKRYLTYPSATAGRADRQMRQELAKINTVVSEHCDNLAPYQFLTAFSQLISRVCHSSDEVFNVLMTIVAKVFLAYPQQAMWLMTAVSKVCVCFCHLGHQLGPRVLNPHVL